jgi:hypothetical protein
MKNLQFPVMVPTRHPNWENHVRVKGHFLAHGPTITSISEGRVKGYFWSPDNAVFDVKANQYGFKASGDHYYFSDIGKKYCKD